MKSTPAGITAFTLFTSAALAEIIRGGSQCCGQGAIRRECRKDLPQRKSSIHIILPQAIRKMLPAIISQFVTVIKGYKPSLLCYRPTRTLWSQPNSHGPLFRTRASLQSLYPDCPHLISLNLAISSLSHMPSKTLGK